MSNKGYAKLSNDLWRNHKTLRLIQERPSTVCIYLACISYCSDNTTDGLVPDVIVTGVFRACQDDLDVLTANGMLARDGDDWLVVGYLDWQLSREQIEHHKEIRKAQNARFRKGSDESEKVSSYSSSYSSSYLSSLNKNKNKNKNKDLLPREGDINNIQYRAREEESSPSPKVGANEESWRGEIRSWEPKPDHFERSRRLREAAYPAPDIPTLAHEFRNSVLSKGNKYGYVDFDAAFHTWIDKRAESLRERQGAAKAAPMPQAFTDAERVARREESLKAMAETKAWREAHPGDSMFRGYPRRKPVSPPSGEHAPASPVKGSGNDERGERDKSITPAGKHEGKTFYVK